MQHGSHFHDSTHSQFLTFSWLNPFTIPWYWWRNQPIHNSSKLMKKPHIFMTQPIHNFSRLTKKLTVSWLNPFIVSRDWRRNQPIYNFLRLTKKPQDPFIIPRDWRRNSYFHDSTHSQFLEINEETNPFIIPRDWQRNHRCLGVDGNVAYHWKFSSHGKSNPPEVLLRLLWSLGSKPFHINRISWRHHRVCQPIGWREHLQHRKDGNIINAHENIPSTKRKESFYITYCME
jgi:hypothetical protein